MTFDEKYVFYCFTLKGVINAYELLQNRGFKIK